MGISGTKRKPQLSLSQGAKPHTALLFLFCKKRVSDGAVLVAESTIMLAAEHCVQLDRTTSYEDAETLTGIDLAAGVLLFSA